MSTASAETGNHFELFGLPARYALDPGELERRYREASRHWHPDRFSRAPASERAVVLSRATDLNQAYRVLKSDARRAEYLLKLHGVDIASEEPGKQPAMSPAFLAEVMELREELLEAGAERDTARLFRLRKTVEKCMAERQAELFAGFARLEAGDKSALPALTKAVLEARYHRRFLDEIEALEEREAQREADAAAAGTAPSL